MGDVSATPSLISEGFWESLLLAVAFGARCLPLSSPPILQSGAGSSSALSKHVPSTTYQWFGLGKSPKFTIIQHIQTCPPLSNRLAPRPAPGGRRRHLCTPFSMPSPHVDVLASHTLSPLMCSFVCAPIRSVFILSLRKYLPNTDNYKL